jgi:hypothetical protein
MEKLNNDMIGELERTREDIASLEKEHNRVLKELESKHENATEKLNSDMIGELERTREDIASLEKEHNRVLKELKGDHKRTIEEVKRGLTSELEGSREEAESLKKDHARVLEELKNEHAGVVERLNAEAEQRTAELTEQQKQAEVAQQQHSEKISDLTSEEIYERSQGCFSCWMSSEFTRHTYWSNARFLIYVHSPERLQKLLRQIFLVAVDSILALLLQ